MKDRVSEFIYPPSTQRCQHINIKANGIQCGSPGAQDSQAGWLTSNHRRLTRMVLLLRKLRFKLRQRLVMF
jgi:hypothetical protein